MASSAGAANGHWQDVSVNAIDWGSEVEGKSGLRDTYFIEAEQGMYGTNETTGIGYDVFSFIDAEKHESSSQINWFWKANAFITLNKSIPFDIFLQQISVDDRGGKHGWHFAEHNVYTGIGKRFFNSRGFFKAAVSQRFTKQTNGSTQHDWGRNGYQVSTTWLQKFELMDEKFTFGQWHEYYYKQEGDKYTSNIKNGHNGDFHLFWLDTVASGLDFGIQLRYAKDYLNVTDNAGSAASSYSPGDDGWSYAAIYTIRYRY